MKRYFPSIYLFLVFNCDYGYSSYDYRTPLIDTFDRREALIENDSLITNIRRRISEARLKGLENCSEEEIIDIASELIEAQRTLLDVEESQRKEDEQKNKIIEDTRKRTIQNKYDIQNLIAAAVAITGSSERLAKKINVPIQKVLNWQNGHEIPDAWSCKRIEQATNGLIKAQYILPSFDFSKLH